MAQNENNVRAIERALRILDCFSRETPKLSLVEIAQKIHLSPSTTSRMVATLENMGYLTRDPQSLQYSLGYRLANLGALCLAACGLREIARPYLVELRNFFNESVGLYILNKDHRVCIDCVHSTQPLHRVIDVGTRKRLTRGASGKLLLAYLPEEDIRHFIAEDSYVTMMELNSIRQNGYATSFNEFGQGLTSVAVPVFNAEHTVEAALFLSGPTTRLDEKSILPIVEKMKTIALEISVKLGY